MDISRTVSLAFFFPSFCQQSNQQSNQVQVVAELANEYGFSDVGGTRPPSIRSLRFLLPTYLFPKILPKGTEVDTSSVPDWLLPMSVMANGKPPS